MEYELTDQDRADLVKNLVKKYGSWFILALFLIAIGFGASSVIQQHKNTVNQNASLAYASLLSSIQNGASAPVITNEINSIVKNYSGTAYASLAQLNLATLAVEQNQFAEAESILKAALHDNSHNSLTPIITLRLARTLLEDNQPKEAILLLKKAPLGFAGAYALLTGEAQLQLGNLALAKQNFNTALNDSKNNPAITQMALERLNTLGVSS